MRSVGTFVTVTFPQLDDLELRAKVDTGAFSGSLFCTDVYVKEQDGHEALFFKPYGTNKYYIKKKYHTRDVKSSNGDIERRFAIITEVVIKNETFRIRITLANRENMKNPVLIGRRFLRRNKFVVDPAGVLDK